MMKFRLLAGASIDVDDALAHYGAISPVLVSAFLEELAVARSRIEEQPQAWRLVGTQTRSFPLRRFPYAVIYQKREAEIVIAAIAHFRRRPGYWRQRLKVTQ
jgi:plasmid stabilization system protein ParE